MVAAADPVAGLPTEFAAFPLEGALLLPRGRLPLNIFEPRYKAMVEDVLGEGRLMAMIQPDPARPPAENGPALYGVGCLGRITSFSETGDGRYLITLTGVARFRLAEEVAPGRGYRRVRADWAEFAARDMAPPDGGGFDRAALLAALGRYAAQHMPDLDREAVNRLPGDWLVTALGMACPFSPAEKQALLESPDTASRARDLLALFAIGAHGTAEDPGKPS